MTLLADANDKPSESKYLLHTFIFQITNPSSHSSLHSLHAWIINKRQSAWRCLFPRRRCLYFFFYLDLAGGKKIFHPRRLGHCERSRLRVLSCLGLLPQSGHEIFRRRWEIRWKWKQPSASVGAEEMASERWKIQEFHLRTERHSAVYRHVTWRCEEQSWPYKVYTKFRKSQTARHALTC